MRREGERGGVSQVQRIVGGYTVVTMRKNEGMNEIIRGEERRKEVRRAKKKE